MGRKLRRVGYVLLEVGVIIGISLVVGLVCMLLGCSTATDVGMQDEDRSDWPTYRAPTNECPVSGKANDESCRACMFFGVW